jgi:hypothetical protein
MLGFIVRRPCGKGGKKRAFGALAREGLGKSSRSRGATRVTYWRRKARPMTVKHGVSRREGAVNIERVWRRPCFILRLQRAKFRAQADAGANRPRRHQAYRRALPLRALLRCAKLLLSPCQRQYGRGPRPHKAGEFVNPGCTFARLNQLQNGTAAWKQWSRPWREGAPAASPSQGEPSLRTAQGTPPIAQSPPRHLAEPFFAAAAWDFSCLSRDRVLSVPRPSGHPVTV